MNRGEWLLTMSGRRFFPYAPQPGDVCIEDIAHALSMICRFGGHVREFYSVAQHSVLVSQLVPQPLKLHGLVHDAAEAYIGDVVRPLKRGLSQYQRVEAQVLGTIIQAFGIQPLLHFEDCQALLRADNVALMTERRDLMPETCFAWNEDESGITPDPRRIVCLAPDEARFWFLECWKELRGA